MHHVGRGVCMGRTCTRCAGGDSENGAAALIERHGAALGNLIETRPSAQGRAARGEHFGQLVFANAERRSVVRVQPHDALYAAPYRFVGIIGRIDNGKTNSRREQGRTPFDCCVEIHRAVRDVTP